MSGPVVVGVDGSHGSAIALRWAATEAALRETGTTAVLAWTLLDQHHATQAGFEPGYGEKDARAALDSYVRSALGESSTRLVDHVERLVVCDLPADALLDAAAGAELLVVGRRGRGGFPGLRLGSVSEKVLDRSTVPVVVVGTEPVTGERVVVGVDGSPTARRALQWAAEEARLRGVGLVVVTCWERPWLAEWAFDDHAPLFETLRREADELLDSALAGVDVEGIEVERRVLEGGASRRLVEAAGGASLLVVGARGIGGVAAALFGSVSRQVVHHATCPVVVLPPEA